MIRHPGRARPILVSLAAVAALVVLLGVLLLSAALPASAAGAAQSLLAGSRAGSPQLEPSPTPTAEPTAEPTASPTPQPTATPSDTPTPAPNPSPTPAPVPSPTATPTASPTPSPTPSPTASPTPSPVPSPTATPTPLARAVTQIGIRQQPVAGGNGEVLTTQPVVALLDAAGEVVEADSASVVTVSVRARTGGALGGQVSVTAVRGVATFTDIALSGIAGRPYVLEFTSGVLPVVGARPVTLQTGAPAERYIIRYRAGASPAAQAGGVRATGAVPLRANVALRTQALAVPAARRAAVLAALRADPQILSVTVDRPRTLAAGADDPAYPQQWELPRIGWPAVHGVVTPAGSAVVAILDTGVEGTHPDLAGSLVAGTSILDGSDGATDPHGHGTAMAGIVAARANNGIGMAGVGFSGVRVMPVTVLDADGIGYDSDIIEGITYAVDHGAHVILLAFSSPGFSDELQAAIDYAWSRGVLVVSATGNGASSAPTYPAGAARVIGVSATGPSNALAPSSNFGLGTFVVAPGTGVTALARGGGLTTVTGTSASAAMVAGVAAFLRAADGTLSPGVIAGRIARSATPVGSTFQTGNGLLNMPGALADTGLAVVEPAGAGIGGPYVSAPYVVSAARTASVSGSWHDIATWGGASVPIAGDTVTINSGITVTVSAPAEATSIAFVAAAANNALIIQGATTLDVSGTITMPRPSTGFTSTLDVGAGTVTAGGLVMSSTTSPRNTIVSIDGGTMNLGTATVGTTGSVFTFTTGTLNISGTVSGTPAITPGSGTVNFTSGAAQNVWASSYNNLALSGAGAKTTASGTITLAGAYTIAGGAHSLGATAIVLTGTADQAVPGFTTTGTVSMTKTGGTATFQGNVTAGALTINGVGGTLDMGAGTTHTFNGTWTRTNGTVNASSSTLNMRGTTSGTAAVFNAGTSHVHYNGTIAQTIAAATYHNLTIGGSNTKTAAASTINGALTVEAGATFAIGGVVFTANGSTTIDGQVNFTSATGAKTFAGDVTVGAAGVWNETAAAAIAFGGNFSFGGVTFTGSTGVHNFTGAGKAISGTMSIPSVTFSGSITNNGALTVGTALVISGTITNNGTLTLGNTTVTITGTGDQDIPPYATTGLTTMSKTGGTATFLGDVSGGALTINGAGGTLDLGPGRTHSFTGTFTRTAGTLNANSSTLNLGGTTSGTGGTFVAGTSTVNYNGAGAQTLSSMTYHALTLSGGGTKTATALTVNSTFTIEAGATLNVANVAITANGNTIIDGAVNFTNATGTKTFAGDVTIGATGSWNETAAAVVSIGGSFDFGGAGFTASTGLHSFTGTGKTLSGTFTIPSVSVSGTYTNNGALTVGTTLTLSGTLTNAGTLTLGSAAVVITGTADQDIPIYTTTGLTTMSKTAGTATFVGGVSGGGLTINGNGGTLNLGPGHTHSFSGTWTRTAGTLEASTSTLNIGGTTSGSGGTFDAGTGTVNYNGAGAQTILALTYHHLTLSGGGTKTAAASTINGTLTVEAGSTFVMGGVVMNANGPTNIDGAISFTSNTGAKTFTGDVTVSATGSWTESASPVVNFGGSFSFGGTSFTAGTGLHSFTGSTKLISGSFTIPNVSVTGSYSSSNDVTVSTLLTVNGELTNSGALAATTLTLNGDLINSGTVTLTTLTLGGSVTNSGTVTTNTLTLNGSFSNSDTLVVNTTLTLNGALTNTGTLTLGSANVVIGGTADQSVPAYTTTGLTTMSKTAGTATFLGGVSGGGLTINGNGGTLHLGTGLSHTFTVWTRTAGTLVAGNSTLNLTGTASGTGGTFDPGTGIVAYNGPGAQTIAATIYHHLTIGGAGTKTAAASTVGGTLTVEDGATFALGAVAVTVNGPTNVHGQLNFTSATGVKTFTGDVTVSATGAWSETSAAVVNFDGSFAFSGTAFTASTGVHTFTGTGKTITGTFSIPNITISGSYTIPVSLTSSAAMIVSGTLVNNGTVSAGTTLTVSGTLTNNAAVQVGTGLTISGTLTDNGTLSVGTGLTISGVLTTGGTLALGAATVTITGTADQDIPAYTTTGLTTMSKTDGTATFLGNVTGGGLTLSGIGGTLNLGAGRTHTFTTWTRTNGTLEASSSVLRLSGSVSGSGGAFVAGTSRVEYIGAAQTAAAVTYHDLTVAGSGAKTFSTTPTVNGTLTVQDTATITVSSGVVTYGPTATLVYDTATSRTVSSEEWVTPFTATGGVVIANTGAITLNVSKELADGVPLTINNGATLVQGATNRSLTLGGHFINNGGTFTNSGAPIVIGPGTSAQSIAGFTATGLVSMTKTGGTATFTGPVSAAALTLNGAGGTLNLGTGLSHEFSGAVTLTEGTLVVGSNTLTLSGPAIAGTPANLVTTASSSLVFAGASVGVSVPSSVGTLANLVINNANGVAINGDVSIAGTLTLTAGRLATGATHTVVIAPGGSVVGAGSASYVNGRLRKEIPTGATSRTFEVGDAAAYAPVAVSFGTVSVAGTLTVQATAGAHPNNTTVIINPSRIVNRYWTLTNGGVSFDTYTATFSFAPGDLLGGANTGALIAGRFSGGTWALPAVGTRTPTSTEVTGLSAFGDIVLGELAVATKLAVVQQPVGGAAGTALTTQPAVLIQDAFNNTMVTDSTTQVAVTIQSGVGGVLGGLLTATASNGVATFTGVTLGGLVGQNYVLAVSAAGLTSATSDAVTVTPGAASQLVITQQPVGGQSGLALTTQPVVAVRDAFGNTLTSDGTTQVAVAITGGTGGSLGGTQTVTAAAGLATFTNLTLSGTAGGSWVLRFTATGITSADASAITVAPGPAASLTVTRAPVAGRSGNELSTQPEITLLDSFGNVSTGDSTTVVTVSLDPGPAGALGGSLTATAQAGIATFSGLTLTGVPDQSYVLRFTAGVLPGVTASVAFAPEPVPDDPGGDEPAPLALPADPPPPGQPAAEGSLVATEIGRIDALPQQAAPVQPGGVTTLVVVVIATNTSGLPSSAASPSPVAPAGAVSLTVPPGAIPGAATVTVQSVADLPALAASTAPSPGLSVISAVVVQATDAGGRTLSGPFNGLVRLTFAVPATAVPAGAQARDFVLATRTPAGWVALPPGSVSLSMDARGTLLVSADLRSFSVYGVLFRGAAAVAPAQPTGAFAYPPVFAPSGEALAILLGGNAAQLEAAGRATGARAAWVQDPGGRFHLLIFDGPAFLRDEFVAAFPQGFSGPTPVTLVR